MSIEMIEVEEFHQGTQIKVIGVGGGGGNAVAHMIDARRAGRGVHLRQHRRAGAVAQRRAQDIQLGAQRAGRRQQAREGPRGGRSWRWTTSARRSRGAHMLFITAGMGGGTGTGAAPVIARVAKEMGILTVGVVTKPFDWEGGRRMTNADNGLAELEANVDSLIVVLNEKLLEVLGDDITQDEAFAHANDVLKNAVGGIAEIINVPGHVNVDFEDVRTVMGEPGKAMMGTAVANGPDRARIAAEQAVACPLLEGIDLSGAKGVLVLITAAKGSLKLSESKLAMNTIRAYASPDAHVIYGTAYDDELGDEVRVTVVATGLSRQGQQRRTAPPLQVLRTGTDNVPFNVPTINTAVAGPGASSRARQPRPAARLRRHGRAQRVAHQPHPGGGEGRCAVDGGMDDFEIPAFLRKQATRIFSEGRSLGRAQGARPFLRPLHTCFT